MSASVPGPTAAAPNHNNPPGPTSTQSRAGAPASASAPDPRAVPGSGPGLGEVRIERLAEHHAEPLLTFEVVNRAYFAASIPDRGEDFFTDFPARHAGLLEDQAAGLLHMHVLVAPTGEIVGRVNLIDVKDGSAELGYRIAEKAAGKGLATAAVRVVAARARNEYGLVTLTAVTTNDNLGSRRVLTRAGFAATADITLVGKPGTSYVLDLTKR